MNLDEAMAEEARLRQTHIKTCLGEGAERTGPAFLNTAHGLTKGNLACEWA